MVEPAIQETFDRTLERLREVVEKLEGGQLPLEDALKAFEDGVGLARRGHALLDAAEKRVEILTRDGAVPFDSGASGDERG
jgi:exodeoxyribonuclease VII small subunit